jgi:CheY-like chemotaxis protein
MPTATSYTILLIEPDSSLRRLITLGLQQGGMEVVEANSLATLAQQAITHPNLLVLDLDNGQQDDLSLLASVLAHPYLSTLPMVVLAWEQVFPPSQIPSLPLRDWLAKPFDARLLHATVDNLLETSASIELMNKQVLTPTATALTSAASFSPMFAAAGLLLIMIGLLLLQLVVAGAGVLVMVAALLWWTLGKRPKDQILLGEIKQTCSPSLP